MWCVGRLCCAGYYLLDESDVFFSVAVSIVGEFCPILVSLAIDLHPVFAPLPEGRGDDEEDEEEEEEHVVTMENKQSPLLR